MILYRPGKGEWEQRWLWLFRVCFDVAEQPAKLQLVGKGQVLHVFGGRGSPASTASGIPAGKILVHRPLLWLQCDLVMI